MVLREMMGTRLERMGRVLVPDRANNQLIE